MRDRIGPEPTVLFDSGIRTGGDVFLALALGADACLLGRPHLYGLALAGADGVRQVIENVIAELDLTMGLVGAATIDDITRDLLARGVLAMAIVSRGFGGRRRQEAETLPPGSTSPRTSRCSPPARRSTSSPRTGRSP